MRASKCGGGALVSPPTSGRTRYGAGIGEVLTFAIGVAISPVPIIAVVLMLFSGRAKVNGPVFLAGWVVALAAVSGIAYVISDAGNVSTDSAAADGVPGRCRWGLPDPEASSWGRARRWVAATKPSCMARGTSIKRPVMSPAAKTCGAEVRR